MSKKEKSEFDSFLKEEGILKSTKKKAKKRVKDYLIEKSNGNFKYLNKIKNKIIADFIINEHPQVIAVILSHLKVSKSAKILDIFPIELSSGIIIRITKMNKINPIYLNNVSKILKDKINIFSNNKIKIGDSKLSTKIIKELPLKTTNKLLNNISELDEEISDFFKEKIFKFKFLKYFTKVEVNNIIVNIEKEDLKVIFNSLKEKEKLIFLKGMSKRAELIFLENLKYNSNNKYSKKDIKNSKNKIRLIIVALINNYTINFKKDDKNG